MARKIFFAAVLVLLIWGVLGTFPAHNADPARLAEFHKTYRMLTGQQQQEVAYTPLPTKKEKQNEEDMRALAIQSVHRYVKRRLAAQKKEAE